MIPLFTFVARVVLFAGGLYFVSVRYTHERLPDSFINAHLQAICLGFSFAVFMFDTFVIEPYFRNSFKSFPVVHFPKGKNGFSIITEMPRGSTPLNWMKQIPDADVLQTRDRLFFPKTVIPISPAAFRDLMSTNTYDFVKPKGLRSFLSRVIGWGLITTEGNVHKRQRKALTPAFNVKHIRALYPTMWEQTGILLEEMGKDSAEHGRVEVGDWASRLALDIIGRAALSCDFKSLTTSEHPVAKSFMSILEPEPHMVVFFGLNLIIPPFLARLLPVKANKVITKECDYLRAFAADLLVEQEQRLSDKEREALNEETNAEGDVSKDQEHAILTRIIASGDFNRDELIDQILTFIAAGHETTGSSISWAMHLLTLPENKHYQATLRNEIRAAIPASTDSKGVTKADFSTADTTFWSKLDSLPYLHGLCEEVLRLFPAVPTTLRESIRKTSLAGQVIPADTLVLVVPWAINRNPRFWGADADALRPERWIDSLPDGSTRPNKNGGAESNYCEITFLHGQRACIGRDFAKAELRCVLAGILGRFEVSRLDGDTGEVEITGAVTTKPRGGLRVKLTPVPGW